MSIFYIRTLLHTSGKTFTNLVLNFRERILTCILFIIIFIVIYFGNQKLAIKWSTRETINTYWYFKNTFYPISSSTSNSQFDVVLSYYSEDVKHVARFIKYLRNVSTIQKLKPRIILYNKNMKINITYLKIVLQVDIVQQLPNLGREGGTYLYHIIENYQKLADHIFFCQAGIEGITGTGLTDWLSNRLEKQFNTSVGYMPLVENKWMTTFDCGVKPGENIQRLPELWGIIEQTLCPPGRQAVTFRGQFLVSAKRIHNRPLRIYQYINQLLMANATHWIHKDSRSTHFVRSTRDNPHFGHILERLWTTLFNCTNSDLIGRCRRNECACFD